MELGVLPAVAKEHAAVGHALRAVARRELDQRRKLRDGCGRLGRQGSSRGSDEWDVSASVVGT